LTNGGEWSRIGLFTKKQNQRERRTEMAKQIILYNLAPHVTDEQYKEYVVKEKGPLLDSLSSVKKFELVKITGSMKGEIPYKYVGIMHISDMKEFYEKDMPSQKFQDFATKWGAMVSPDFHTLIGEEIY
jgi:hypothetical protein